MRRNLGLVIKQALPESFKTAIQLFDRTAQFLEIDIHCQRIDEWQNRQIGEVNLPLSASMQINWIFMKRPLIAKAPSFATSDGLKGLGPHSAGLPPKKTPDLFVSVCDMPAVCFMRLYDLSSNRK